MRKSLKAVLFDLDGTLLDSFSLHYSAYEAMFAHFGIAMDKDKFLGSYSPNWYCTYETFGLAEQHWEAANRLWLEAADCHTPELFPGVYEMLDLLAAEYKLGIVTSGSKSRVVKEIGRLNITDYFATVVTGDDVAKPKPDPQGLHLALSRLSLLPDDVVYIGDACADFEMSRAARVRFIGVTSDFVNLELDHEEYKIHTIAELPSVLGLNNESGIG
jgi:pyrophosphatase PpaX